MGKIFSQTRLNRSFDHATHIFIFFGIEVFIR